MKLYILKNFQRYNQDDFYSPLTDEGNIHAENFAHKLKKLQITHIYCSPYLRVLQSVLPFLLQSKLHIRIDYLLKKMISIESMDKNKHQYGMLDIPNRYFRFIDQSYDQGQMAIIDKIETFADVLQRVKKFVQKLTKTHSDNNRILIVTHSSVLNVFKQFTTSPVDDNNIYRQLLEITL